MIHVYRSSRAAFWALFFLSFFAAHTARSQTVGAASKLPEAQQREIILHFAQNAIANLSSKTDTSGKPKSAEQYEAERAMANLVRALFTPDQKKSNPRHPDGEPPGPKMVLFKVANTARKEPNKNVLDVMSGLVDWAYAHFYTNFYNAEGKAKLAKQGDDDQVTNFRLNMELFETELAYDLMIAQLEQRDEEIVQKIWKMYDEALILADGRHIMRADNGDFIVVKRDPDSAENKSDVKLEGVYKREAQRIYDCMQKSGISIGQQAREAGCK